MTRPRFALLGASLASFTFALAGCLEDRSFHQSDTIRFAEPVEGDFAASPLLVRWEDTSKDAKKWAVFLDRAPIRPGASVEDLEVQERENLWVTTEQELTIDFVPPRRTSVASRRDQHRLVVVPLDADGERLGEHAASVALTVIQG